MSILGDRIKTERENLDLTREELAKKIGVSYSAIAMYEQGNREPNNDLMLKMCEIFDCTLDYLIGKSDYKTKEEEFNDLRDIYTNNFGISTHTFNTALLKTAKNNLSQDEYDTLCDIFYEEEKLRESKSKIRFNVEPFLSKYNDLSREKILSEYNNARKAERSVYSNIYKAADILEKIETADSILEKFKYINEFQLNDSQFYMCPVYGRISAGQPNWAEECIEGRIPIDPDYMNITEPTECFFLKVNGESMNKEIKNGAYALIRRTDFVENGEIAVVLVNGYDATLKKFSKQGDLVILEPMSNDTSFTTQVYGNDTEIKVIGKYIGKMEMK